MSTFKGVVDEFPDIRIDYFRKVPNRTPPLACFLSHVHSDHLLGLEILRSPFIYCSPGTRELLLRLEKYPHRMNFAKGVLESRKVHYKDLKSLLKPIPLHTPTDIELAPSRTIRVTLFDANHCAGAVMFLIEGDSKAVLYTGDIRSEPWWVNNLARHPTLLPYTLGNRRLNKIYLDTTFAVKRNPYTTFPTKADGLSELLTKIAAYPDNTIFHFNAWTFGYEEVWMALASFLGSKIHVDRYKMRLYQALTFKTENGVVAQEGPPLCGFKCGNRYQPGCLTNDTSVRLHSCETGTSCHVIESSPVVWITPIITRASNGSNVPELGAGGGGGDLLQSHELDLSDPATAFELIKLCSEKIVDAQARSRTLSLISEAFTSSSKVLSLDASELAEDFGDIPLEDIAKLLERIANRRSEEGEGRQHDSKWRTEAQGNASKSNVPSAQSFPSYITFPYSRHSSYNELCHLVGVFKPMDVYPCTVDENSWNESVSMDALFGHLCSAQTFVHDQKMMKLANDLDPGRPKKRSLNSPKSDATRQSRSQTTESISRGISIDPATKSSDDVTVAYQTMTELTDVQNRPSKRPRLAWDTQNSLGEATPKEVPSTADASTDTSHDRRIQALRVSFENGLDSISARRPSLSRTESAPALSGPSASKSLKNEDVAQGTKSTYQVAGTDLRTASRVITTSNSSRVSIDLYSKLRVSDKTKEPEKDKLYSKAHPENQHAGATKSSAPSLSNHAAHLTRDGLDMNKGHYKCSWLACEEIFLSMKRLRRHVIDCHMIGVSLEGVTAYGCLWEGCAKPKITYHSSQNSWEEHMDCRHFYARKDHLQILGGKHDAPVNSKTLDGLLPTPPKEMIVNELAIKSKISSTRLGDNQTEMVEFSDTASTSSGESFPRTIDKLKKSFDEHRTGSTQAKLVTVEDDDTNDCSEEEETQLSLPDSAFDSQQSTNTNQEKLAGRTQNRKEAYKTAKGLGGREWATYRSYGAVFSDSSYHKEEVELG